MSDTPDTARDRDTRLRTISRRIEKGEYRVEPLDLADAILRRWRMEDLYDERPVPGGTDDVVNPDQSNDGSGTSFSSD